MAEQEPYGAEPVGWVNGIAVSGPELEQYLARLSTTRVGDRVGAHDALGPGGPGGTGHDDLGGRAQALRVWAVKALLADRLLESETARLGIDEPRSPQSWVERLEACGELDWDRPSEPEVRECYEANRSRYEVGEARRVRHVLLADHEMAAALAASGLGGDELAVPALSGSELAERAGAASPDNRAGRRGEDLGWVGRGQLAGALEEAIFAAVPGEVSGPVQSPFGWHLLVVDEVRPAGRRTYEECSEEIVAELSSARQRDAWREWWARRLAEAVRVAPWAEHPLLPGLPGRGHRH